MFWLKEKLAYDIPLSDHNDSGITAVGAPGGWHRRPWFDSCPVYILGPVFAWLTPGL